MSKPNITPDHYPLPDKEWTVKVLRELLDQERDHPESLERGHGRALSNAIRLIEMLSPDNT